MATTVKRFSNTVEHRESTALAAADDAFEVDCKSDTYTFLLTTTGSANYVVALEMRLQTLQQSTLLLIQTRR